MVSIREVASLAKVSMMTVSRVVNETGYVSKETREKVLKIIQETGYEVNQTAVGLRTGTANSIGVIISDISNTFFPPIIKGIDDVFSKHNYDTILFNTAEDARKELRYIALLKSKSVKGILISSCISNYQETRNIFTGLMPVFFNRKPRGIDADVVLNNDHKMLFTSTEHLINLGHKKIAFINGPLELSTFSLRYKGFLDAMNQFEMPIYDDLIINEKFSVNAGYKGAEKIFSSSNTPDAVLLGNNLLTRGAFIYIKEKKIIVPDQISFVGYGDFEWCSLVDPPLTVSEHDRYKMGSTAAEILLKRLSQNDSGAFQETILDGQLLVRSSVKSLQDTLAH
jgi:LacI family transcriptional regulator